MPIYDAMAVYDPILTNFSIGYKDQAYIADQLSPIVPVTQPSGKYPVFDRSTWVVWDDHREPGAEATEVKGFKWAEDNYYVQEHAVQAAITDEERQVFATMQNQMFGAAPAALGANINPETDATTLVTGSIVRRLELDVSTMVRTLANYPAGNKVTLSGTGQWSDYSGTSDPLGNIETGMRAVYSVIFRMPNVIVIPWIVWSYLRNHPKIVDRVKSFQLSTAEAFQEITGFQGKMLIPTAVYNTSQNVDAAETATSFWGKDVILACVDETPQQNTKTFSKTFAQVYDNGQIRTVDRWREPKRWSDVVACKMRYQPKITSNVAGYIIQNAVA